MILWEQRKLICWNSLYPALKTYLELWRNPTIVISNWGGVKGKFLLLDYWSILQFLDEYIQHEVLTLYCTVHDQYSLHSI